MTDFQLDSRYGFTYQSKIGYLATHNLWALPFSTTKSNKASLNGVYSNLMEEKGKQQTHSLTQTVEGDPYLDAKINIVKFIFETRQAEKVAKKQADENAELKQLLLSKAREKQVEAMLEGTPEELIAKAQSL